MLLTFLISLQKRFNRFTPGSWLWLAIGLFSCCIPARAQFVICNNELEAHVSADGQGLVTVYYGPCGTKANGIVHESQTSFLTVLINDDSFYTNNYDIVAHDSANNPPYTPAGILNNGTTRYTGPNKDTIETVWEPLGPNTYKIIQDIYLKDFPIVGSGQVVYRFSIENLQNTPLSAQAQYLLDIDVGGTDNAPVTTRYDFLSDHPLSYPNTNTSSIPSYFIATQEAINSATFPGLLAEGFCNDSLAPEPMGLMEPSLFAYVQWPDVVTTITWGAPTTTQTVNDGALLYQWPPGGSNNGQTNVIGSFSYGTAACSNQICFGNLDAIMLHPEHIVWDGTSYSPNPFPVEGIVWNQNNQTALTASGTQTITNANTNVSNGPIKIISPMPTTNNGYTQNHSLSNGATILGQSSSSISWLDQVLTGILTNCADSIYNIAFSVAAGGVGSTSCQNGTYICPVEVDCQLKDVIPPGFTPFVCVAHDTTHCGYCRVYTDTVFDNRSGDEGMQSITWVVTPNPTAVIVDTGTHSPCSSAQIPITVTQIDTLQAPCVYFTFTDCANNISRDTICFDKCLPPGIVDTLPPRFRLMDRYNENLDIPSDSANFPCEFQCSKTEVTDSVEEPVPGLQRDGGLKSITVVSQNNMSFTLSSPVTLGMKEDTFSVCVIDSMLDGSIVIGATDSIGNVAVNDTITYCTVADTLPPVLAVNPLSGGWLVTLSEKRPWDRGVDSVLLTDVENCWPVLNASLFTIDSINDSTCSIHPVAHCPDSLYFSIEITDTFMNACFTIEASDCPANTVSGGRICKQALADTFCPTDTVTQISPTEIMVIFSDYHQGINYDVGLDSITFTNVHNMSMKSYRTGTVSPLPDNYVIHEPNTGNLPAIYPILDTVFLSVTDPTLQDTAPANVCWTAIDGSKANNGGGNYLCTPNDCFSYILSVDTTPPIVTINYDPCDTMAVTITDTRPMDRGIYNVWLDTSVQTVNLLPFSEIDPGASSLSFILPIIDPDKSASGHLTAFDLYGDSSLIPAIRNQHTTTLDFAVYRENMAMKASGIVNTPTSVTFNVPVYLDSTTDTFALGRKNITQFQFTFQITGSNLLSFIGTQPALATMHGATGWNITSVPGALPRSYTITGQTTGAALTDAQATDTIAYLTFNGQKSPDVEEAQIIIDSDDCGNYVIYNGGTPTTVSQPNVTITTPPPAGLMTGGSVIFMDSCATIIGNNPHPTILSIAPAIPNPFTGSTLVQYTVPSEANVTLDLYNALGQKVRTIVNDDEKQGTYQITLDAQELPGANYFLRLQANGQVCSQQVVLNK